MQKLDAGMEAALSMTSRPPMATMNVSASIFISGWPLMKFEMGR